MGCILVTNGYKWLQIMLKLRRERVSIEINGKKIEGWKYHDPERGSKQWLVVDDNGKPIQIGYGDYTRPDDQFRPDKDVPDWYIDPQPWMWLLPDMSDHGPYAQHMRTRILSNRKVGDYLKTHGEIVDDDKKNNG